MIPSGFFFWDRISTAHCCTFEIRMDKHLKQDQNAMCVNEAVCGIFSIQTRILLLLLGVYYLHFFFLVLVYVHFHLRLRNEVWSASVSHSVSFTMWILMLRKQRKTKLFSPTLQIWNPEFFSILQEIFPWTRSSLHLTHYWISQSPRLVVKPQMYHLLSYLVNFRQLWYKSYWHWQFSMDWCVTVCLTIPVGTSVDQKAVLCSVQ